MPDPVVTPDPSVTPPSPSVVPAVTPPEPSKPSFTFSEDRSRWVPPDRLTAAERATNLAASKTATLEAAIADRDRKIAALAGVAPHDPAAADVEATKAAFAQMFPSLAKLAQLDPQRLEQVLANSEVLSEDNREKWDAHRDKTFDEISSRVASAMGMDKLSDPARRKVTAAFKASVPDMESDPDGYAAWAKRYQRGDVTLLDEFVQEFVGDFITPAQRSGFVRPRVAVPSGGASRPVAMNQNKQPEYAKMKSVKDMLTAAEEQADAYFGQ